LSRSPNQGGEARWTAADESCIDHASARCQFLQPLGS
jgi:hypothetical protein